MVGARTEHPAGVAHPGRALPSRSRHPAGPGRPVAPLTEIGLQRGANCFTRSAYRPNWSTLAPQMPFLGNGVAPVVPVALWHRPLPRSPRRPGRPVAPGHCALLNPASAAERPAPTTGSTREPRRAEYRQTGLRPDRRCPDRGPEPGLGGGGPTHPAGPGSAAGLRRCRVSAQWFSRRRPIPPSRRRNCYWRQPPNWPVTLRSGRAAWRWAPGGREVRPGWRAAG